MAKINENLKKLERTYTFKNLTAEIGAYKADNPNEEIISLGVGDVSRPVVPEVVRVMHGAVNDLSDEKTFKGYGAYYGYNFLKEKILKKEYEEFSFSEDEIYISNGTKTDTTSILELFSDSSKVCLTDPMYPIYIDGTIISGKEIKILKGFEENNFIPEIPKEKFDIIYICSPGNPTGVAYNRIELKKWVDYALENKSIILYDNVYAAFITSSDVPKSIYEIEGAKSIAIEFRSFSKRASFTGVRCSYYIIPEEIVLENQEKFSLNDLWKKRTINKFNGADYIAQKGAFASYLPQAEEAIAENIKYYLSNAKFLRESLIMLGFSVYGGIDAPFIWAKIPEDISSWEFFRKLLSEVKIVVIPGEIFGEEGKNFVRISALGKRQEIEIAIERLKRYYEK